MKAIQRGVCAAFSLFAALAQSACDFSDAQDGITDPFPPPEIGLQLSSPELVLEAGDERYVCQSFEVSDAGLALVSVSAYAMSPQVHHFAIFTSQAVYPGAQPYDCKIMDANWGFLTGGGPGDSGRDFPSGTAMTLPPKQHVVFQLHLANVGDSAVIVPAQKANLVGTAKTDFDRVGVVMVGTLDIHIPAHAAGALASGGCALPMRLQHIFGVYPHMHRLGRSISTQLQPMQGEPIVLNEIDWNFDEQQLYEVTGSAHIGDQASVTCVYDNPSDQEVHFGLNTSDEMCFGILYYYPADKLSVSCGIPQQAGP